mmetsp:Transcript_19263/g.17088  ORF Transcript_19263/g.17088 Transcript_19263/m.17088 type:complete len:124 (-) Transcript_19263:291-662(-)
MRTTRSMVEIENGQLNRNKNYDEKKLAKKRHTKSMEKDLGTSDGASGEEQKLNSINEQNRRALFLMNKRIPIYQEYDDFLKRRRKDKRVEFILYNREAGEEVLSKESNVDLLKYYGGQSEDTF